MVDGKRSISRVNMAKLGGQRAPIEVYKELTVKGSGGIIYQGPVRESLLLAVQGAFGRQPFYRSIYIGEIKKSPKAAGEKEQFTLFFNLKENASEIFFNHLVVKPTAPEKKFIEKCILPRMMNGIFGGTYKHRDQAEFARGILQGRIWLGFEDFNNHLFDMYWNNNVPESTGKLSYIVNI